MRLFLKFGKKNFEDEWDGAWEEAEVARKDLVEKRAQAKAAADLAASKKKNAGGGGGRGGRGSRAKSRTKAGAKSGAKGGGGGGKAVIAAAPPAAKPVVMRDVCNNTSPETEGPRDWHVFNPSELDETEYPCFWTNLTHWQLTYYHELPPIRMCTHDPEVDTVISSHLHKWGFWGAPDEFMILLNINPCTEERPYMLDIGMNIGLFTLIGAEKGCHVLGFEPLSENIQRAMHSLLANGYEDHVMLFKHAVGKYFTTVTIGFRPSNPGSSGINLGGSKSERIEQITIDGLLLGHSPPSFAGKSKSGKDLPKIEGSRVNFAKIDTEGYDVAVVAGMMQTLIAGRIPHMLIEFGPMDAQGTAGCDPDAFVRMMYENGYSMYEFGKRVELKTLTDVMLPEALSGQGRRVFEAWWILDTHAARVMKDGKLKNDS